VETTAPRRALSSLCRFARRMVRDRDQRALISGEQKRDVPPLQLAGRIGGGAARRYHLVAVTPLDLGALLTAGRP
jgi:hypothetical protein